LGFCCVLLLLSPPPPACADDIEDARAIVFSGRDVWLNGAFLNGGVLWSPTALDEDGLLFKFLLSGGLYRYNARDLGGERVIGSEWAVQLLPGWHVKRGTFELKVFMGPEFQQHRLSPDDPGNLLNGSKFGLRLAGEIWDEPTTTTMIAADASLGTTGNTSSARIGFGWGSGPGPTTSAGRCSTCFTVARRRRFMARPAIRNGVGARTSPASRPGTPNGRRPPAGQSTAITARARICGSASCSALVVTSQACGGNASPR
jgi:hypothetical protein